MVETSEVKMGNVKYEMRKYYIKERKRFEMEGME